MYIPVCARAIPPGENGADMQTNSSPRVVSVSLDDTLKQMRAELAREFPGVRFSVTRSRGTGYGWVRVAYINGPRTHLVNAITNAYEGQGFDGMTDSTYSIQHASADANGEPVIVQHGTKGINVSREVTADVRAGVTRLIIVRFEEFVEIREHLLALSDSDLLDKARSLRMDNHEWLSQAVYRALEDHGSWFGEMAEEIDTIVAASTGDEALREEKRARKESERERNGNRRDKALAEMGETSYSRLGEVTVGKRPYVVFRAVVTDVARRAGVVNRFMLIGPNGASFGVDDLGPKYRLNIYSGARRGGTVQGLTRQHLAAFGVEV